MHLFYPVYKYNNNSLFPIKGPIRDKMSNYLYTKRKRQDLGVDQNLEGKA